LAGLDIDTDCITDVMILTVQGLRGNVEIDGWASDNVKLFGKLGIRRGDFFCS
jgi:hypothetical protein